jgi:hypothetical protein
MAAGAVTKRTRMVQSKAAEASWREERGCPPAAQPHSAASWTSLPAMVRMVLVVGFGKEGVMWIVVVVVVKLVLG